MVESAHSISAVLTPLDRKGGTILWVQLIQGATVIALRTIELGAVATYQFTLGSTEIAQITDYTALELKWWVTTTDPAANPAVTWFELEVPGSGSKTRSHFTDFLAQLTTELTHTLSAYAVARLTVDHDTDFKAVIRSSLTHTASSFLVQRFTISHGTDFTAGGSIDIGIDDGIDIDGEMDSVLIGRTLKALGVGKRTKISRSVKRIRHQ